MEFVDQIAALFERFGPLVAILILAFAVFVVVAPPIFFAYRLSIQANAKAIEAKARRESAVAQDIETDTMTRERMDKLALEAIREARDKEEMIRLFQADLMKVSIELAKKETAYVEREKFVGQMMDDRERRLLATETLLETARGELSEAQKIIVEIRGELELAKAERENDRKLHAAELKTEETRRSSLELLNERLTEENRLLREQNQMLKDRLEVLEQMLLEVSSQHKTISTEMVVLAEKINKEEKGNYETQNGYHAVAVGGDDVPGSDGQQPGAGTGTGGNAGGQSGRDGDSGAGGDTLSGGAGAPDRNQSTDHGDEPAAHGDAGTGRTGTG
jgi:hypothetical protein